MSCTVLGRQKAVLSAECSTALDRESALLGLRLLTALLGFCCDVNTEGSLLQGVLCAERSTALHR